MCPLNLITFICEVWMKYQDWIVKYFWVIYKHFHQTIKCYIWLCVTTFVTHFSKNAYLQKIQYIETKTTFATWFLASWQNSLQNGSSNKLECKFELAITQHMGNVCPKNCTNFWWNEWMNEWMSLGWWLIAKFQMQGDAGDAPFHLLIHNPSP